MNYENLICAHCGKLMHNEEDIVVCPVCATPQHRECWMQSGHCANASLHDSGYIWERDQKPQPAETVSEVTPDSRICHICGSENPNDSLHCGNCGALFGEDGVENIVCSRCRTKNDSDAKHCKNCGMPLAVQGGFFNTNPYMLKSEFSPDDVIAERKAGDIATYVQASSHRYLRKFKKFADGKKLSVNFAAFFFAPYWFFYRKLYKAGVFFIVVFATVSMMLSGLTADISVHTEEFLSSYGTFDYKSATEEEIAAYEEKMVGASMDYYKKIAKPLLISSAINFGISLLAALVADKLYYKKVMEDMKEINDSVKEENMRKLMLARKGGLSAFAFALSVIGYNFFINIMVYAADFITNSL